MDTGSYTYSDLAKKNDNFTAPGFEVSVDGKELSKGKYLISRVEVEISSGGAVGGCSFTIDGQYDYEKGQFINDAAKLLKPGAKLEIKGGYEKREEIFFGYLDDYCIQFNSEGTPRITVNGLDGLGYLMNMCEPFYAGEKQPKEIIETVLNKSKSAGYAKDVTIGQLEEFKTPIIKEQIDDWKFLCLMAQRYGATLLAIDGELVFDTLVTKTAPLVTLTVGESLLRFTKRVSLAHQVGKVEVLGRDINQKPIQGTASSVTAGGDGKTAAEWVSGLKEAVLRERSEYAQTEKECNTLAQNRLNSIAMGFVSGEGECIGIPQLIPGRYSKIDGADEKTNGSYFITKVIHRFSRDRYVTRFEVKGAKTL